MMLIPSNCRSVYGLEKITSILLGVVEDKSGDMFVYSRPVVSRMFDICSWSGWLLFIYVHARIASIYKIIRELACSRE